LIVWSVRGAARTLGVEPPPGVEVAHEGGGQGGLRRLSARRASFGLELKAGLSSASNSAGYVVPEQTERAIERRLMAGSPMREIATVRRCRRACSASRSPSAGVGSGWVAETAARPETDPATLALLEFPSADLYACPAATQSLLDDALVDLDEWLAAEVEDAFAAQETHGLRQRRRDEQAASGFLNYTTVADADQDWGEIGYVASGGAGAFATTGPTDRLIDLVYAPKAQYRPNARFVMNRKTVSAVRKFKDADGNYIWQPAQRAGETASCWVIRSPRSRPCRTSRPTAAAIAFGDFQRGYLIVDRAGSAGAEGPVFGQALCAVLHDPARRRRGAEFRRHQGDEVRGELTLTRQRTTGSRRQACCHSSRQSRFP
jgi:HK97 family phage major capsid protein